MRAERIAADPTYLEREAALEAEIQTLMRNSASEERGGDVIITIPIVFHIINLGGTENITNEQVLDAVRILNEDYRALNPDIMDVHPAFDDVIGDARIQFALPTLDPHGFCTNGIDRVRTPETLRGSDRAKMNPWPRDKYLNIWVVRSMERPGVAGYAYYPGAFDSPIARLADGIIILHDYIGQIGTGTPYRSTALSHEVGHYLNLPHVWGNNNGEETGGANVHMVTDCGDDGVHDTPRTRGWNQCPEYNHVTNGWATDCNAINLTDYIYAFAGVTTSSGTTDPTVRQNPTDTVENVVRERAQLMAFTANGIAANSSVDGKFAFGGWDEVPVNGELVYASLPGERNPDKYYSFTVQPNLSDLLHIDSLGFRVSRDANGIRTFAVRSSVNNYATNLPIRVSNPNLSVQTSNVGFIRTDAVLDSMMVYIDPPNAAGYYNTDQPVTFRFYGWNAEGANGVARVCSNSAPIDLFDKLGSAPQPGGTWSGPSETEGLFDPAIMEGGTYTYSGCGGYTATVEVSIIAAPDAPIITGTDAFCAGGNVTLTSSVTSNIRWSTGQTTATITVNTADTYTVTVTSGECTATSEPFAVTVFDVVNAGGDGTLTICDASAPANLFANLIGTPQAGGVWTGPSDVIDGLYDPATMEPGVYEYSLEPNGACASDVATVTVAEGTTANAGTDATVSVCNNASVDLFDRLGGGAQSGGVWTKPDNSTFDGIYDATTMANGTYHYSLNLDGGCGSDEAQVVVSEINAPPTPTITGTTSFCAGTSVQLVSSSSNNNLWSNGITTPGNNVSLPGTYSVRVTNSNGCFSVSAPFVLTRIQPVNAGGDGEMTVCTSSSDVNLFTPLVGTPNTGGTWSGPSAVIDGLYHPASMEPGVYTYTVTATSPCPNDFATVTVTESATASHTSGYFGVDDVTVYGNTSLIENVENYMEYSYCSKMFTVGQVDRMRFALNSTAGERNNLWTENNLRVTGVAEGSRANCAPQADFFSRPVLLNSTTESQEIPYFPGVCTGEDVQFVDKSGGGFPTSWEWTFQDGNPATSNLRNPVVRFSSPGYKEVTLVATNANGSSTKMDPFTVLIGGSPNDITGTYHEGFQNSSSIFPWTDINFANNITSWRRTTTAGQNSNASVMLNASERNYTDLIDPANGADYDDLYSPSFDLSGMSEAALTFNWAYSTSASDLPSVTERLLVSISTNCGENWVLLPGGEISGGTLINNGNNPQLPPPAWSERSLTISAARRVPNVRFRFRFISSENSGNLYIDNINILGPIGIEDLTADNFMSLYPNPTNDQFVLGVHGMDKHSTSVTITDIRGAVVYRNILSPTNRSMEFSASELGLSNGLYLIHASNEMGNHTQKLMVGK